MYFCGHCAIIRCVGAAPAKTFEILSAEYYRLRECGIVAQELRVNESWFDWVYTRFPDGTQSDRDGALRVLDSRVVLDPTVKEFRFV